MGSPPPNPPSSLPAASSGPAVRVSPVMAGQEWADPNGALHVAVYDGVHVELLCTATGDPVASLMQSPDAAISLARLIQNAAVQVINTEVRDDGRKLTLPQRMARITAAHTGAPA